MEIIKELITQKYDLYNIDQDSKLPVNITGNGGIKDWPNLTFNEMVQHHNMNSTLWCMRMGTQTNGKRIMSLDFDIYDKKTKSNHKPTEELNEFLRKGMNNDDECDGWFLSSTEGNCNLLIDYTNSPTLCNMVDNFKGNKSKYEEMEILMKRGSCQVIPPSMTVCKKHNKPIHPREFTNPEKPFYIIIDDNCFLVKFIMEIMDRINKPKEIIQSKTQQPLQASVSKNDNNRAILSELIYILKPMSLDNYNVWNKVGLAMKNTDSSFKDLFHKFSALDEVRYDENECECMWDGYKEDTEKKLGMGSLIYYARQIDAEKTNEILAKYKVDNSLFKKMISYNTTADIADYFIYLYGDKFIRVNDQVYIYNGVYWEKEDIKYSGLITFITKVFVPEIEKQVKKTIDLLDDDKSKSPNSTSLLLRNSKFRKGVIEDIIAFITNNKIKFDNNPYLIAFNNKVFDLKLGDFVEPLPKYYISQTTEYDYVESSRENIDKLDKFIDTIFPNQEIKQDYLTVLATGLCGFQIENLFVASGEGRNGKGVINSLMMKTVGKYGYNLPSHALLQEIKEGPNPELANLHNKRFVVCSEPEKSKKVNCSAMKKITGDRILPVRSLYSANCETVLLLTLLMECNTDPVFDEVNAAVLMRIRNSLFENTFYTEAEFNDLDEETKKTAVLGDPYYKTENFRDEFKCVLFDLLIPYFNKFQENNYKLKPMPKPCALKCNKYLAVSDDIYGWFNEFYVKTEKIEDSEPISFTTIYDNFKHSEFFDNLNKADKRKYNRKYFCEQIEKNMFLKKFVKNKNSRHNGITISGDSIIGWKRIIDSCLIEIGESIEEMK